MLYRLAHILRDKFPWLWDIFGVILSWMFSCRYVRKLSQVSTVLEKYSQAEENTNGFEFKTLTEENAGALAQMLSEQPEEAFDYFRPHGFTVHDLRKLIKDHGFLAYVVVKDKKVVGYFFQRSFFWGKAYRGYITDYRWRRKGINRMMNECATDISALLGLRVFGTIAPENIASLKSAETANEVKIIKTLDNGDYFVEYLKK